MKVILVGTIVALISLSLTLVTLAAPTQWKTDNMKNQLLKSIISQALQEDPPSTKDKDEEMVASFCKSIIQILKFFNVSEEFFGPGDTEDDYCQNFELPPEPRPEDKSTSLANAYQEYFNLLKNSGIDKALGELIKFRQAMSNW